MKIIEYELSKLSEAVLRAMYADSRAELRKRTKMGLPGDSDMLIRHEAIRIFHIQKRLERLKVTEQNLRLKWADEDRQD